MARLECLGRDPGGECNSSRYDGWQWTQRGEELDYRVTPRLVLGPEFSWRFAPTSLVTPVLHLVVPAVDVGLSRPRRRCARGSATPGGDPAQWQSVEVQPWEEEDAELTPDAPILSSWRDPQAGSEESQACEASGLAPPFMTGRIGLSVEVRPTPQLVVRVRADLQPLLWSGAVLPLNDWPTDYAGQGLLHGDTQDPFGADARVRAPVLGELRVEAGVVF